MVDTEYGNKRIVLERYRVYPVGEKPFVGEVSVTSRDVAFIINPDARTLDDIAEDIRKIEGLWASGQD